MDWLQKLLSGQGGVPRDREGGGKRDFGLLTNAEEVIAEAEGTGSGQSTPETPGQEDQS